MDPVVLNREIALLFQVFNFGESPSFGGFDSLKFTFDEVPSVTIADDSAFVFDQNDQRSEQNAAEQFMLRVNGRIQAQIMLNGMMKQFNELRN
jgi:hypothetical protein